jgi:hypothetical protein
MQEAKKERCWLLLAETGTVALAMPKNISNQRNCQGLALRNGQHEAQTKVTFPVDYSFLTAMGLW